jgi:hypothetical protein
MTTWTEEAIRNLVSDVGALRDGQKLAQLPKWMSIGRTDVVAWGAIKGSGATPYQVSLDLEDMGSKCSCPSRRFPCKHAVALMLLTVTDALPSRDDPPDGVKTWLVNRQRKREAAANPPETPPDTKKAPDPAKQAKTEAARLKKVEAGIGELRLFLEDTVRQGLGDPRIKEYGYWDRIAGRMVDAQMSPIAKRLRDLAGIPYRKKNDWVGDLVAEMSRLYALTEAYLKREMLSDGLRADVQVAIGFTVKQDDILINYPTVTDRWKIIGQIRQHEDALIERRTWLYGETTRRYALILEFAHSSRPFTENYTVGHTFEGDVVYYPSAYPLRVAVKRMGMYQPNKQLPSDWPDSVDTILDEFSAALALNPFLERIPVAAHRMYPTPSWLTDTQARRLPMRATGYTLEWYKAVVGEHRSPVFGEWDGNQFTFNGMLSAEGWICLTSP